MIVLLYASFFAFSLTNRVIDTELKKQKRKFLLFKFILLTAVAKSRWGMEICVLINQTSY